jgi:hypothetical protein
MSTAWWLAAFATALGAVLAVSFLRTRVLVGRLEARVVGLEGRLEHEISGPVSEALVEARSAGATARRAATAAGVDEPPRRLPFEPVTGPVVRAVAFGAGARRAIVRMAGPRWAQGRARKVA